MIKLFFRLLLSLFCGVQLTLGQNTAEIFGTISAGTTGQPLAGANVLIKNTYIGTATANDGSFSLKQLEAGEYTLVITMMGYRRQVQPVLLPQVTSVVQIDIQMTPDVLSSPQVVVTATRKVQDIMEAPVAVSVLGPRQINSKAAFSLEEILPYQAGISIVRDQINIRGANSYSLGAGNRSLLLLDGVPLTGSAAGNITWAVVPTSEIARVEIVKSSGSALYGSSAMGGVINIITRNSPATPETRFRLKVGQYSQPKYDQWRWREDPGWFHVAEITHARPFGQHGFWVRLQQRRNDGYYRLDWEEAINLAGKVKLNFGTQYSAALYASFLADQTGISSLWRSAAEPFEAPAGYENDRFQGTKFNLSGSFNFIYSPNAVMKVRTTFYDVHWQNDGLTNNDFSNERKYYGEYQVATNWNKTFSTTTGIVLQRAAIDAKIFGRHSSYSGAVYFLGQQRLYSHFNLSWGGRYESYWVDGDIIDRTISPQVALNFHPNPGLALRASVGHGFRVPTIAELFTESQLSVFKVRPNPDLVAETSLSKEVGGTLIWPGRGIVSLVKFDASLFSTTYDQMIEPVIFRADTIHFENIVDARITGAEFSLSGGLLNNFITTGIAYTWLDPIELDKQGTIIDTLSYRYRHIFNGQATITWHGLFAATEYRYASRIERVELFQEDVKTGRDRRVPINVWNFGLGYRSGKLEMQVRVENLFQYYYVDLERNMGPERKVAFSINYTL